MKKSVVYSCIAKKIQKKQKQFAVLIDPDKVTDKQILKLKSLALKAKVDYFFVGGSLLTKNNLEQCLNLLKERSNIPVILFPGSTLQIHSKADAIFLLSLISGRNPELLIGKHVVAAPFLKSTKLEIIPTGYMLIDGGKATAASYMSGTLPIPSDKDDIALNTAMAGEMLGLQVIYLDAGSGAIKSVSSTMVSRIKQQVSIPLIVGGGIKTSETARSLCKAGADVIVVGNAIEKDPQLILSISKAVHSF